MLLFEQEGFGVCNSCIQDATYYAISACITDKPSASPVSEQKPTDSETETPVVAEPAPTPTTDCVSTLWIEKNGFSDGIMKKFAKAPVLCIPDLPCGTPGHALRECDIGNKCRLHTYKEICEDRNDCVQSVMPVSRLRSSFDWSAVTKTTSDVSGSLTMTSISMHPDASYISVSRMIANVAEKLIQNGMGWAIDSMKKNIDEVPRLTTPFRSSFSTLRY